MANKDSFPQYRKYSNNKSFFKIVSEREFIEHKVLGRYYEQIHIKAQQYPEMVLIQDLLQLQNEHILPSTEEEYEEVKSSYEPFSF